MTAQIGVVFDNAKILILKLITTSIKCPIMSLVVFDNAKILILKLITTNITESIKEYTLYLIMQRY